MPTAAFIASLQPVPAPASGEYVYPAPAPVSYPLITTFIDRPDMPESNLPYLVRKAMVADFGAPYDSRVVRISKTDGGSSNGFSWPNRSNGEARCAQHYNVRQAWVGKWPDGRLGRYIFLARKLGSPNDGVPFLNGDTYEVEFKRSIPDGTEAVADPTGEPRFIYLTNAGSLRYWYPVTDTEEVIASFNATSYGGSLRIGMKPSDTGGAEWAMSNDGAKLVICGNNGKAFVYDILTDTKYADWTLLTESFAALSPSPLGDCIVVAGFDAGRYQQTRTLTGSIIATEQTTANKHQDLALDSNGDQWLVGCDTNLNSGQLVKFSIPNLTKTVMTSGSHVAFQHVSCRSVGARSDGKTWVWTWADGGTAGSRKGLVRVCLETGQAQQVCQHWSNYSGVFADQQHPVGLPYGSRCLVRYNADINPHNDPSLSGGMTVVVETRDWTEASL